MYKLMYVQRYRRGLSLYGVWINPFRYLTAVAPDATLPSELVVWIGSILSAREPVEFTASRPLCFVDHCFISAPIILGRHSLIPAYLSDPDWRMMDWDWYSVHRVIRAS